MLDFLVSVLVFFVPEVVFFVPEVVFLVPVDFFSLVLDFLAPVELFALSDFFELAEADLLEFVVFSLESLASK